MTVTELQRKYNPDELRAPGGEHGGQWVKNPATAAEDAAHLLGPDELDLADRMDLEPDEHLVMSDTHYQRGAESQLDVAIIQRPSGRQVRLGITSQDDEADWPGDSTTTLHLEPEQVRKFQADLTGATKEGKRLAAEASKIWESGDPPADPRMLGTEAIAEGHLVDHGGTDFEWSVFATDDERNPWELAITTEDAGTLTYTPREAAKLLKFLQGLDEYLGPPSTARAYSQESGPTYQAPSGPPSGGQFAKGGGRVGAKGRPAAKRRPASTPRPAPKPAGPPKPFGYDGKTGTGYGVKGGDPGVRTLQAAVNRLGILDSAGNELAVDGRYGPRTTSAVKKLQKALGMQPTGQVTPEFLKQVSELKQVPPKPPRQRQATAPKRPRRPKSHRAAPARRARILAQVSRALGEHRMADGVCTCSDADPEDDPAVQAPTIPAPQ